MCSQSTLTITARFRSGVIAAHAANYDVHAQVLSTTYRDDVAPSDPHHHGFGAPLEPIGTPIDDKGSINLFSPHNYWRDMEASGLVIYSNSGWSDGAFADSAIKRFLTVRTPGAV